MQRYFFLILLVIFLSPVISHGQTTTATSTAPKPSIFDQSLYFNRADVAINEIKLDDDSFRLTEFVSGFFDIENKSRNEQFLRYRIDLVLVDEVGSLSAPIVFSELRDVPALPEGDSNRVRFSYQLPARLPEGQTALVVTLFRDQHEEVVSRATSIRIPSPRFNPIATNGIIIVNNKEPYDMLDTPVVKLDETVELLMSINSPEETIVIPVFEYYQENSLNGPIKYTFDQEQVVLARRQDVATTYRLPLNTIDPGVYTVRVRHYNRDGLDVAVPSLLRYVVGEQNPSIESVTFNSFRMDQVSELEATVVFKDTLLNNRIDESGQYVDVRLKGRPIGMTTNAPNSDVSVSMFIESFTGEVVAESEQVTFNDSLEAIITFPNTIANGRYQVVTRLFDAVNEVIDEHIEVIEISGDQEGVIVGGLGVTQATAPQGISFSQIAIGVALFIALILVALLVSINNSKKRALKNRVKMQAAHNPVPPKFEVD